MDTADNPLDNDGEKVSREAESKPKQKYLRLSWAGGLRDLRDEYTSVELQHKIMDWWDEDVAKYIRLSTDEKRGGDDDKI